MLKYISALVAAITPLMYFHGALYHDSHLRTLGIPPELFQISLEETLVQGFLAYTLLSLPLLMVLFMYSFTALGVVHNLNEMSKFSFIKNCIAWIADTLKGEGERQNGHALTERALKWTAYSFAAVFIALLVLGATIGVATKMVDLGKQAARQELDGHTAKPASHELRTSNGNIVIGYVVTCSGFGCAMLSGDQVQILPQGDIKAIISTVKK